MKIYIALTTILLSACAVTAPPMPETSHPFVGCWVNESGLGFEEWGQAPNGWLMGYAMNLNDKGETVFFEQMRIELGEGGDTLFVSGGADAATPFKQETSSDPNELRFVNPKHDHPQVITYWRKGNALNAQIAKLDGTGVVNFPKKACK